MVLVSYTDWRVMPRGIGHGLRASIWLLRGERIEIVDVMAEAGVKLSQHIE